MGGDSCVIMTGCRGPFWAGEKQWGSCKKISLIIGLSLLNCIARVQNIFLPWPDVKKGTSPFDIGMGGYDGAEKCKMRPLPTLTDQAPPEGSRSVPRRRSGRESPSKERK